MRYAVEHGDGKPLGFEDLRPFTRSLNSQQLLV